MNKFAIAQSTGRSHISSGTVCQDKTYALERNGVRVITLADGAGSCCMSHFGAETVCKVSAECIASNFDAIYNAPKTEIVVNFIIDTIMANLNLTAGNLNCNVKDLSSTMLIAAVKDGKYLVFSLGDGVIGFRENGEVKVATKPVNGKYANETVFVTCSHAKSMIQSLKGTLRDGIDGFVLMSDGSASSFYNKRNESLNPMVGNLIDFVNDYDSPFEEKCAQLEWEIERALVPRTHDDCSLAIMAL